MTKAKFYPLGRLVGAGLTILSQPKDYLGKYKVRCACGHGETVTRQAIVQRLKVANPRCKHCTPAKEGRPAQLSLTDRWVLCKEFNNFSNQFPISQLEIGNWRY